MLSGVDLFYMMNWHSKDWLTGYITQRVKDTPRNQRYVRLIEDGLEATRASLDLDWLAHGDQDGYRAREQTNVIGCLSFAWQSSALSCHEDGDLLEDLRRAYLSVARHVTPEGKFEWPNDKDMYWAGSHEHAWRLEPLLLGYIWVGDAFPDEDREEIASALRRASDWLIDNPCDQHNNRGAVWCAIAAMCGIYFDRPDALEKAESLGREIMPAVILEDGKIGEHTEQYAGGGPCTNYTYTGLGYVYLYLLLSNADWLEERLHLGMRWLSRFNSRSGYSLATGASVRSGKPSSPIQDSLPPLERYSKSDPVFGWLAERYTARTEARGPKFGGHITCPFIWAALEAGTPGTEDRPAWFQNQLTMHTHPNVQYALYSGRYQTGVTFRSRKGPYRDIPEEGLPFRGLQAFAWEDESPIVYQRPGIPCSIQSGDRVYNLIDVEDPDANVRSHTLPDGYLIAERKGNLVTAYALTPAAMVVWMRSEGAPLRVFWALGATGEDEVALERKPGVVAFANRHGRLYFSSGDVELYRHTEGTEECWVLDVIAEDGAIAFGFSDARFEFDSVTSEGRVSFTDSIGSKEVDFGHLVDREGQLVKSAQQDTIRSV